MVQPVEINDGRKKSIFLEKEEQSWETTHYMQGNSALKDG